MVVNNGERLGGSVEGDILGDMFLVMGPTVNNGENVGDNVNGYIFGVLVPVNHGEIVGGSLGGDILGGMVLVMVLVVSHWYNVNGRLGGDIVGGLVLVSRGETVGSGVEKIILGIGLIHTLIRWASMANIMLTMTTHASSVRDDDIFFEFQQLIASTRHKHNFHFTSFHATCNKPTSSGHPSPQYLEVLSQIARGRSM